MSWIRDTDERPQRRPSDVALLSVAGLFALLLGMWAQTQSSVDVNLFRTLNDLTAGARIAPGTRLKIIAD